MVKIRTVYFVDHDPAGKSLDEYFLAFGPAFDGSGLRVLQCTKPAHIHEDAVLISFDRGDAVKVSDGNLHRAVLCQLTSEAWLEKFGEEMSDGNRVLNMPPKFAGKNVPEVKALNDNQLAPFKLSINVARSRRKNAESGTQRASTAQTDVTSHSSGAEPRRRKESIWSRLGRLSKRLFR